MKKLKNLSEKMKLKSQSMRSALVLVYFGAYATLAEAQTNALTKGPCKFYQTYLNNDTFAVLAGLGGMALVGKQLLDEGDQKLKSAGFKWAAAGALVVNSPTLANWTTGGSFCGGYGQSIFSEVIDLVPGLATLAGMLS